MIQRFTIDGSDALERHLGQVCTQAVPNVQSVIPPRKLEAIVLGGGYGRGEGGVLIMDRVAQTFRSGDTQVGDTADLKVCATSVAELPYNDLDFYVFVRGNQVLNAHRYQRTLNELGEHLSAGAGLHVEFKIESLDGLRSSAISMFSYDLVTAHRILYGKPNLFEGCDHHRDATRIPNEEATRLLFNRCTGLLLAKDLLRQHSLTPDEADFVGRNLAKAQLAMGDALLTVLGQYHWSVLERQRRLEQLQSNPQSPISNSLRPCDLGPGTLDSICRYHSTGVEFKLHPKRMQKSPMAFDTEHAEISAAAQRLWLWLESRRLDHQFSSAEEYALSPERKCNHSSAGRNFLLNVRTFGVKAALDHMVWRYPRERLFNALNLLLWNAHDADQREFRRTPEAAMTRFLQKQLRTSASEWSGLVAAYKQVWPSYG